MDLSSHGKKFPAEISEYFLSSWETHAIWRVEAPRRTLSLRELNWHLDCPFFSSDPPAPLFDLKPRSVLDDPHLFPKHWARVLAADLRCPIDVSAFGDRLVILDGLHRLLKSNDAGAAVMECRLVPRRYIRTAAGPATQLQREYR
jgi:hypothetical protein